jgi:hypothetical protein
MPKKEACGQTASQVLDKLRPLSAMPEGGKRKPGRPPGAKDKQKRSDGRWQGRTAQQQIFHRGGSRTEQSLLPYCARPGQTQRPADARAQGAGNADAAQGASAPEQGAPAPEEAQRSDGGGDVDGDAAAQAAAAQASSARERRQAAAEAPQRGEAAQAAPEEINTETGLRAADSTQGEMMRYARLVRERLREELSTRPSSNLGGWLLKRIKRNGGWLRTNDMLGQGGVPPNFAELLNDFDKDCLRDIFVWLPEELYGFLPDCPHCQNSIRVGRHDLVTSGKGYAARRVTNFGVDYFVMTARYVCHTCKDTALVQKEKAQAAAQAHLPRAGAAGRRQVGEDQLRRDGDQVVRARRRREHLPEAARLPPQALHELGEEPAHQGRRLQDEALPRRAVRLLPARRHASRRSRRRSRRRSHYCSRRHSRRRLRRERGADSSTRHRRRRADRRSNTAHVSCAWLACADAACARQHGRSARWDCSPGRGRARWG